MAGRFAYFLIAGGAIIGGMFAQGDLSFDDDRAEHAARPALLDRDDRKFDRAVDRIVERGASKMVIRSDEGQTVEADPAMKRALAAAIAELVRAEGSLITARLDDEMPAAVIEQAERRRNAARQAVERISEDAKAETRANRDAVRQRLRDEVREGVRDAVRS